MARAPGPWEVGGEGAPDGIPKEQGDCGPCAVGSLVSRCRAIVTVLVPDPQLPPAPPPGVSSLSFCVTYIMPLRTILETSRPTCD